MIEHVRRRALMSKTLAEVFVATCDDEIADVVHGFGGKVIMTAKTHKNGTTRVAEAVEDVECSHVMLIQGDEPLLLPRHIDAFAKVIECDSAGDAWNATAPIENPSELDRHSFVKCAVGIDERILLCFRKSPFFSDYDTQKTFVRKILGLIAYRKSFLIDMKKMPSSKIEYAESIEQMKIIENGFSIKSIQVSPSLPSVNEPTESAIVLKYLEQDAEQRQLFEKLININ